VVAAVTTSTALWCACGTRIVGCGYVEAIGGTSLDGPRLCRSCAVDHGREVPGSIVPALTIRIGLLSVWTAGEQSTPRVGVPGPGNTGGAGHDADRVQGPQGTPRRGDRGGSGPRHRPPDRSRPPGSPDCESRGTHLSAPGDMQHTKEITNVSRYNSDPRVSGYGSDGFTVSRDGTDYRVLPTGVFGWVVCAGPNLDFAPTTDGGFAIGFATSDEAIGAVLGEDPTTTSTANTELTAEAVTTEDSDDDTDGMRSR
jgi:hypothetical protein